MRAPILTFLLTAMVPAQTVPTNVRMQNVVKAFSQRTGQQVIGLGSWISGTNYNDVLKGGASDHDLRLVIQRSGLTPAQAQQEWQAARRVLRDLVTQEFGKDAGKILGVTNLYPPNQLMKGVEDAADAMQRFQKLGQVPNLGYAAPVNAATPKHLAEGLYGDGAQVWTQMYEHKTGRLFYTVDGRVYTGMVDLSHLAEGQGKYSIGGMANTSMQWVEHAEEELSLRRGDRVGKYLERLERDLGKAKDMARVGGDSAWTAEIRDLSRRLKANPGALNQFEGRVTALLKRSHMESAILGRLAKAGPVQGAVLKAAMAGIAAKNQFGQMLSAAAQKIPMDRVIQGVIAIVVVQSGSRIAGEAGLLEALRQEAPWMAGLPAGVLMGLTNAILDGAKAGGFDLVASYQDPWDLLSGNFTAAGRVSVDDGRPYTVEELVKRVHTEEALSNFVHGRAAQAAYRGFQGRVSSGTDSQVAESIFKKCHPPILRAWQTRREQLRMEYLDLAEGLRRTVFPIVVTPSSAKLPKGGRVDVLAEALPPKDGTLGHDLDRMKEILTWLQGGRPYALVTYGWAGGQPGQREAQRQYTFREGGTQPVVCNVEIGVNESRMPAGDPMIQRVKRFSAADVQVDGEIKPLELGAIHASVGFFLQPPRAKYNDTKKLGLSVDDAGKFDYPDVSSSGTTVVLEVDVQGRFSYSAKLNPNEEIREHGTYGDVIAIRRGTIAYSGTLDFETWTFRLSGTYTKFNGAYHRGNVRWEQDQKGMFSIRGPMDRRALKTEIKPSEIFVQGTVETTLSVGGGGSYHWKLPLAGPASISLAWKSPRSRMMPEVAAWEKEQQQLWWDEFSQEAYQKFKAEASAK